MPKETLKALDRDVERLLFAGAQVARTDGDLDARKTRLAPLGAKAPAIAKVTEQIEKVQKASGKTAASELLSLAALMAQVRGAQAAPAQAPAQVLSCGRARSTWRAWSGARRSWARPSGSRAAGPSARDTLLV